MLRLHLAYLIAVSFPKIHLLPTTSMIASFECKELLDVIGIRVSGGLVLVVSLTCVDFSAGSEAQVLVVQVACV
jgi:hypothetical protein